MQARERNAGDFVVACDLVYFAVPGFLIIRKPEAAEPTRKRRIFLQMENTQTDFSMSETTEIYILCVCVCLHVCRWGGLGGGERGGGTCMRDNMTCVCGV